MSFDDGIGDECGASAVVAALPTAASHNGAELHGAIIFRVFEGFVAPVAPAEAGKYADVRSDFLFEVQAKAVAVAAFAAGGDDIGKRSFAILEFANRLFVVAHGGLIQIAEEPNDASAMQDAIAARFEFEVRCARAGEIGVEIDSVRDFGHERFGEARGE